MPDWPAVCHWVRRHESQDMAVHHLAWGASGDLEGIRRQAQRDNLGTQVCSKAWSKTWSKEVSGMVIEHAQPRLDLGMIL